MNEFPEGKEYRLILKAIPAQATERVINELTTLLPLDKGPAGQIVQAAPIVLLDKLTAVQARNVESSLGCLRRLGVDVTLSSETTTLKRLSWPVMPEIARHRGNAFVCPHCGERLIVQSAEAQQAPVQAVRPAEPVAAKPAPAPATPRKQAPAPQPSSKPKAGFLDLAADLAELDDSPSQQPATPPAARQEPAVPPPARPAAPAPAPAKSGVGSWSKPADEDDDELELLEEAEPVKPAAPAKAVQAAVPAAPAARPVQPAAPARPAAPPPAPAKPAQPAAPAAAAKPGAPQNAEIGFQDEKPAPAAKKEETPGGNFRVSFMAKLKPAQKKPVADLIVKHQGIPAAEALAALSRPFVTVLRNATEEQAEQCKKDFKALGITVQVIAR